MKPRPPMRTSTELLMWLTNSQVPIQCVHTTLDEAVASRVDARTPLSSRHWLRGLHVHTDEKDSGINVVISHDTHDEQSVVRIEFPMTAMEFHTALDRALNELLYWRHAKIANDWNTRVS